jgi:hypothetical protein
MRRLRAQLEQVADVERETAAQTRESMCALKARVNTLQELVHERDAAMRESEQARLALLEKTKRLQAEALTRADDLELKAQRMKRMEETIALLTDKVTALESVRSENTALRSDLDESKRAAVALERQVDLYRETARAAESRQLTAELAASKSEALVKQYLSSPAGEDRLRLENRIGALQEKIRDLSTRESRLAERFRTVLTDELASTRRALALEKIRTTPSF